MIDLDTRPNPIEAFLGDGTEGYSSRNINGGRLEVSRVLRQIIGYQWWGGFFSFGNPFNNVTLRGCEDHVL